MIIRSAFILLLAAHTAVASAQFGMSPMRTIKKSGDFSLLKGETAVLLKFTYDNMVVGKYTEADYVTKKTREYNEKEAGHGDQWAVKWVANRAELFEPRFEELFNERLVKYGINLRGSRTKTECKYMLVVHTTDTEPGYNVGISRMPGYITAVITLREVAAPDVVLAEVEIERAPAQDAMGFDFDAGGRIAEGYAKQGKELATWFGKKDWGNLID